ncbi:MAG: hypothetical protein ACI9S8_000572 [Chlamydiales bacterium]|jgi:hypothetical protein
MKSKNSRPYAYGFYLVNLVIVVAMFYRIEHPEAFLLMASGAVMFSFFLKRWVNQLVG